ncbi:MAG: NfeD family protein [Bacteroidales bacterium]
MIKYCLPFFVMMFLALSLKADSVKTDADSTKTSVQGDTVSFEAEPQQSVEKELVYVVEIKEQIAPPVWRLMQKGFDDAKSKGASLILLHMNTYGGLVEIADSMRTRVLNSKIPVVVFIDNNAASAGALISIASDSIYMKSGANIGAATVVNQSQEAAPDKYQSYMRSTMRSTAEAKGRNPDIAEAMVDPDKYVEGVSDSGKVLTLTASEAVEFGFCEGIYSSVDEVILAYGYTHYEKLYYEPTGVDKIIGFLVNPFVNGILIMLIIGGIYFELQSPGIGFPIIAAITASVLYFAPLYLEGLAEHWEILLFVGGLILIAVEIFAIPGFGVAGISGIILLVAGLSLSLVGNVAFDFSNIRVEDLARAFLTVIIASFMAIVASYYLSMRLFAHNSGKSFRSLALQDELTAEAGYTSADANMKSMVSHKGKAYTVLRPSGKIIIGEDIYDATAENGYIEKGEEVEVVSYHNTQLIVARPFDD